MKGIVLSFVEESASLILSFFLPGTRRADFTSWKTSQSNRLIYNPQYSEVRVNEPYILSNQSSVNTSSYQMPLRDHSSPLGGPPGRVAYDSRGNPNFESNSRHDSTFGSRRNSLGYRSVRSQKAITARYTMVILAI